MRMTFLGHATVLFESKSGARLLVDPWLDGNPGCPYTPASVPAPDVIAVTHGGRDHLGDTLDLMERFPSATLVCGRDVRAWAKRKGVRPDRIKVMVSGFLREAAGFRIRAVETRHGSFFEDDGVCYSDACLGYVISAEGGGSAYHMADTSIFSDLKLIGELYRPDVTLVPVGHAPGALPEMSPDEAALAAAWAAPKLAVPFHYEVGAQDAIVAAWREALEIRSPQTRVRVMRPGEALDCAG